jgi:hypothetical protein
MHTLITTALLGQYEAALTMLKETIDSCPAEHWEANVANVPARIVAFHTLYCTDTYLSRSEAAFESHPFVMEGRGVPFGQPLPPGELPRGLSQPRTLEYIDFCIAKARTALAGESEADLAGDNGFGRSYSRAEMHIYNIRHIQHHAGALAAHIRRLVPAFPKDRLGWIGSGTR